MFFKIYNSTPLRRFYSNVPRQIDKLLIANRGEIACRIMRTAKRLGIKTVAVFSDADKDSVHVEMADEAFNIGAPPSIQSYLKAGNIIEVAKRSKCSAIHPGYGFLSENVEFAKSCEENDIIFVGPPASAIRDMGIKSTSKIIMSQAGVPVIAGYHGDDQTVETLKAEARKIGFPVMIKAVRGGGGKGMRIALTETDFEEALESAKTEASKAVGDNVMLLEKFIEEPRHVEVQVFADKHGNTVHLFERDCSVQRRHQKIVEEAPAPGVSSELRDYLGRAAVKAAKAVGYVGAGTVEFILDRKTQLFYFMEMNTRLQVEHMITEMITDTDLVEWQLKIASGDKLPVSQEDIKLRGHAFEARIYAENPEDNFLPGAGHLRYLQAPQETKNIRVESGVKEGDEVSVFYDPMIAKLVVWGENRLEALTILRSKLSQYQIAGLETNVNFLLKLASHPEFQRGNVHTNFIRDNKESLFLNKNVDDNEKIQAALAIILSENLEWQKRVQESGDTFNPFIIETDFRVNHNYEKKIVLTQGTEETIVNVKFLKPNVFQVSLDDKNTWKNVTAYLKQRKTENLLITIDGYKTKTTAFQYDDKIAIFNEKGKTEFVLPNPLPETQDDNDSNARFDTTPMPGIIDKIFVKEGDDLKKGDNLYVLIAMKMELIVKSSRDAKVSTVNYKPGDNVPKDATVVAFV